MRIEIHKPELERMVHEEIQCGHFSSVDELLMEALGALREKKSGGGPGSAASRNNLAELLMNSPFAGANLDLERRKDYPHPLE